MACAPTTCPVVDSPGKAMRARPLCQFPWRATAVAAAMPVDDDVRAGLPACQPRFPSPAPCTSYSGRYHRPFRPRWPAGRAVAFPARTSPRADKHAATSACRAGGRWKRASKQATCSGTCLVYLLC